jgi:hypothetical protein
MRAGVILLLLLSLAVQALERVAANEDLLFNPVIRPQAVLPPPQYDKPYDGRIIIIHTKSAEEMRQWCGAFSSVACARFTLRPDVAKTCIIVLATNAEDAAPIEVITRHERAHCNGWPALHPGARAP